MTARETEGGGTASALVREEEEVCERAKVGGCVGKDRGTRVRVVGEGGV